MAGMSIVVRAVLDSGTINQEGENSLKFHKGQMGLFVWTPDAANANFLVPKVIWDHDPAARSREVLLSCINAIGIEINGIRLTSSS